MFTSITIKKMTHANPVNIYIRYPIESLPRRRDYKGRSLDDIIGMSDYDLERTHDYIQVLFPTTERSMAVRNSPVLPIEMLSDIYTKPFVLKQVQEGLYKSFRRMLRFYGLELYGDLDSHVPYIMEITGYTPVVNWRREGDHNSRRITRIITSLKLFDLDRFAEAFSEYLSQTLPNHSSRRFWGY